MAVFLILLAVALLIGLLVSISGNKKKKSNIVDPERKELTISDEKFNEFFKEKFRPEYRQGKEFKIAGLNHRKDLFTYGDFEGYIKPEVNNPYDKYAIGVYSKYNEELVGYLPKSDINKKLFNTMLEQDALLYTSGYISEFTDDDGKKKLYGRIYLDIE